MPELFSVKVVAVASVTPVMLPVPDVFTVNSRVPAAAVMVSTPPRVATFRVVMPLPVNVPAPVALLMVIVFNVLPVDATVVDVSVAATVVKATPVETREISVAEAKVTAAASVVPAPAST